jgi:hypothetical protein
METYYTYLRWCRDYNEKNLIDPTSDEMEWHHTLPKCIFGDIRIGLWLTLRQHAIATALQTLAFSYPCLCGWHKQYIPEWLWDLAIKHVHEKISSRSRETALKHKEKGVGLFDPNKFLEYCASPATQKQKDSASAAISLFWSGLTPEERSKQTKNGCDAAAQVNRKRVLITFPDGTEKVFKSSKEALQVVKVSSATFNKMKKTGVKSPTGYFARNLDE